ncbi:hypothetical protein K443DRAFT_12613 [Laccaria amethystina LaAM-08-1]|uniref:Uncharacterized protein n=1 Tax=Laccaria amethystina LaAM-08-1 TaxID=1095629 RepID=A0A0C9X822_9AGAR|nr:hypothetical protein K443DRAFT_12613 [Laccaria amethystina LaAM-08-1]
MEAMIHTLASLRALTYIPAAGFTFDKMLHATPGDVFHVITKIHVRAPSRLIRQAASYFRLKPEQQENGSIINVFCLYGRPGQANYAPAKAAVLGLTKTIAKEWGPISAHPNAVAFGLIHTTGLTASEETDATIKIDGKKVALGFPGGRPVTTIHDPESYTQISLCCGGTPDDTAGSVLLPRQPNWRQIPALAGLSLNFCGLSLEKHQYLVAWLDLGISNVKKVFPRRLPSQNSLKDSEKLPNPSPKRSPEPTSSSPTSTSYTTALTSLDLEQTSHLDASSNSPKLFDSVFPDLSMDGREQTDFDANVPITNFSRSTLGGFTQQRWYHYVSSFDRPSRAIMPLPSVPFPNLQVADSSCTTIIDEAFSHFCEPKAS